LHGIDGLTRKMYSEIHGCILLVVGLTAEPLEIHPFSIFSQSLFLIRFLNGYSNVVLNCDTEIARRYGEVKDGLRQKGHPIPENDIWAAAIALHYALTLITRDAHFNEVEGLKIETW